MNPLKSLRDRLPLRTLVLIGISIGIVAAIAVAGSVDTTSLQRAAQAAGNDVGGLTLAIAAFAAAFALRAAAWQRVLPSLSFGHALAGIHATLGANHVLPFRLGEPTRVLSVVRRTGLGLEAATASTLTLRAADMLTIVALGVIVAPTAFFSLVGAVGWLFIAALAVLATLAMQWIHTLAARRSDINVPGPAALALSTIAWLFEAVLVWQTAQWAGIDASWTEAVLVTTVAVAAQIAAFAPGGFGTYEAAAVAAWTTVGFDPGDALVAALAAHALKTAYSLLGGLIALVLPAPAMFGRLRLPATPSPVRTVITDVDEMAPVLLFMPAFNEEASVGECIARAPDMVLGRRVEVLVVDDGSGDRTIEVAREAGAQILKMGTNQGLGAAVRAGFAEGVARGSSAIVFCDADGEYPPEELENLVRPIFDGTADYVGGSRFAGRIDHMHPHRRFGNIVLTKVLCVVARRKITDGQTGYRAFSPAAAADAEIIHDFNYAQVLTLDLLAKGYRYHEVPISYHFRTTGESFIKLGNYLRNVLPAIYRELNAI